MTFTLESLGIDRMSVAERIDLIHQILESISAETNASTLTDEQREELERRWQDSEANPDDEIPWEQVKQEALSRCG